MDTPEAISRLRARHPQGKGEWATAVEFCAVDFFAVGCWRKTGYDTHGYEIKVSRGDWLRELRKTGKADPSMARCDYWYLAAPPGVLKDGELPAGWGYVELGSRGQKLIVQPTRLTPPSDLARFCEDPSGSPVMVHNRTHFDRVTFAMLARRLAYAEADRDALAAALDDEARVAALDTAALATGRWTAAARAQQREWQRGLARSRKTVKAHAAHSVDDVDPECSLCRWQFPT